MIDKQLHTYRETWGSDAGYLGGRYAGNTNGLLFSDRSSASIKLVCESDRRIITGLTD